MKADVTVRRSLPTQEDLRDHAEHCSVDAATLTAIAAARGHQVRVVRTGTGVALYTVTDVPPDDPRGVVRMGEVGRKRLGTDSEFAGVVDARVPDPTLSEEQAEERGDFIERARDDGRHRGLIAIAPHGGDIEVHTDCQAERVAERLARHGVNSWRGKGWKIGGGAFDAWHITSTEISEESFPVLLALMSRRFTYAVAFHGFDREEILVGGAARVRLKREIAEAIRDAVDGTGICVRIAGPDDRFGGDDPRNIVNRLTAGGANGVQIEQSLRAREERGERIADAVAGVYERRLRRPWIWAIRAWIDRLVRRWRRTRRTSPTVHPMPAGASLQR